MAQLWFKFWAKEYLADTKVRCLDYYQRGILQTLWSFAWEEGSIPANPRMLGNLLGLNAKAMRTHGVWIADFFVQDPRNPDRLISPRLEIDREEADSRGSRARESAMVRWNKRNTNASETHMPSHDERIQDALPTHMPSQCEPPCESHAGQGQGKDKKKEPDKLAPVASGSRKAKGIVLGDYSPEFEEADSTWRRLFKETRAFIDFIPADKVHVASAPGSKAAGWGAWKRLLTFRVNGIGFVQPSDLLEAVKAHAAAKTKRAMEGTELNLPMFSTLLNKPEMLDAVVHIVKQRHEHLEIPA